VCVYNIRMDRLLSEEVFEFSLKQLTSKKIHHLKARILTYLTKPLYATN
jgi:hypothetical protein